VRGGLALRCDLVDAVRGRLRNAPTLGWQDLDLREPIERAIRLPVVAENSVKARVLAQLWAVRGQEPGDGTVAFVNASDGVGRGFATILKAVEPRRLFMSGEITEAWGLILPSVQQAMRDQALFREAGETEILIVPLGEQPRLRGAAVLVNSPVFAPRRGSAPARPGPRTGRDNPWPPTLSDSAILRNSGV
jgi:predicted NBD/HSP70 family sugar kinase